MFSTSGRASHASFRSIKLQITISVTLAIAFLLVAGIRAASPGARDLSFGSRGVSAYKAGNTYHYANAIVLQPDGKLISVGGIQRCEGSSCNYDSLLVRFNANGTIDNTFGNNGAVVADYLNQNDELFAAALQPDGKIVAAGGGYFAPASQTNVLGFKIMRFLPSGARDTSFGTNGIAYESFDDLGAAPESMFIQPDGKIVVAGTDNGSMLFIARFNPNGSLDASFGTNGKIVTNSYDVFKVKIARQSDGKIIVAGIKKSADAFKLIRFNSNGTLDTGYGSGGTVTSSIAHYYYYYPPAIALQPDDKLIFGASSSQPESRVPTLKRFNADGSVDSSFAVEPGEVLINNCMNCTERPTKILLLPDGRFYVFGFNQSSNILPKAMAITRYLSNGAIDKSFGFRGSSQFMPDNIRIFSPVSMDAVLQPDGKVAFTGYTLGTTDELQVFVGRVTSTVTPPAVRGDFDGDGKTDFAVYRPTSSFWYVLNSSDGSLLAQKYGTTGDVLTPADYNHDMKTDLSVFRASHNYWVISTLMTPGTGATGINFFGQAADIRVPEDYDGDAQADLAVFSPSSGDWKIRYSSRSLNRDDLSNNYDVTIHFGLGTDKPVPADYDGDGQADLAVFRPSNGFWYILRSSDGGFQATNFGLGTDKLVPGDYDGDLKTDIAVFRDGNWYILRSTDNGFYGINWGLADDKPVPGDYDGDGKFDFAVFRPTTSGGSWYMLQSSNSSFRGQYWGLNDDIPIPFTFVK